MRGGLTAGETIAVGIAGTAIGALAIWRERWDQPLHALGTTLLALAAWLSKPEGWWVGGVAAAAICVSLLLGLVRARRRSREADGRSEQLATQLDRRISELFSLQELSYVLSESIQLDRIVDQVARYASRFLQTDGAIVVLADDELGLRLRVTGATGTLRPLLGRVGEEPESVLVRAAISRERIEVAQGADTVSVDLLTDVKVRSAAVAPLRSQGITMGALAVADRRGGPFTTEDLWLLSTVATNASVVLANSRLYEIVRRSKDEWETAFNALTEGIAVVGPDAALLRANRALAALAGMTETGLVGQSFCQTIFGNDEMVSELIAAALRGERTAPLVARIERTGRVLRLTAAPIADRAEPGPVVILVEDVTEQRNLEAQVIQNDKMASIGQLVSGVAHELNNPLTSIAGLAELLLEREPGREAPREHLRVIHEQAERAGRIVRNLLTFARKGVPEKAAVDLNDVAARTSLLIVYELQLHGIELDSALSPEPIVVLGDRYELQQVLLNLVNNAVQAVNGLEPGRPRRISIHTSRSENQAMLAVRDTGPGVPAHLASYLFTPFFTTKGPGEGTGLGLSLSYGLVKSHGGVLTYEALPEGGAEFRITLPFYETAEVGDRPSPAGTKSAPAAAPMAAHETRRILLVHEDPAAQKLVSALFGPAGHSVETIRSGEQGLRAVGTESFDLIIADARMTTGASELFVQAVIAAWPSVSERLIIADKPLNPRDLHARAAQIFASTPPRSQASTAAR
ncbi:MAG TPA: ATP-binding protein [Gemmatimonadales bacterium]|jgi:two-component system NtrC family sensor kinase